MQWVCAWHHCPDEGSVVLQLLRQKSNIASGIGSPKPSSSDVCDSGFIIHWQKLCLTSREKGVIFIMCSEVSKLIMISSSDYTNKIPMFPILLALPWECRHLSGSASQQHEPQEGSASAPGALLTLQQWESFSGSEWLFQWNATVIGASGGWLLLA